MTRNWHTAWQDRLGTETRHSRTMGALDLAPLADVVLLLVIFALIANGFVYQPCVQIDLPAIDTPAAVRGRVLTLTVTAEEFVYVTDPSRPPADQARPVVLREAIASLVADFARRHPDGTVLIKADANMRHSYLLQLLEVVRNAGIRQIAFGGMPHAGDATPRAPHNL